MIEIRQSVDFADWLADLADKRDRARIAARIDRMNDGNFGDAKSVGDGVNELRLHHGPGFQDLFLKARQLTRNPPVRRRQRIAIKRHRPRQSTRRNN